MDEETKNRLFEQLFPLPQDRPRRTLRFGTLPQAKALPESGLLYDDKARRPPFQIVWEDSRLGLRFTVREQENGDVVANVDADTREHAGKVISLALVGSDAANQVRRKIRLVKGEQGGCGGEAAFGKLQDLAGTLGQTIQPSHFLIEESA